MGAQRGSEGRRREGRRSASERAREKKERKERLKHETRWKKENREREGKPEVQGRSCIRSAPVSKGTVPRNCARILKPRAQRDLCASRARCIETLFGFFFFYDDCEKIIIVIPNFFQSASDSKGTNVRLVAHSI